MKKLIFVMALLWCGGAAGYWYYNDPGNQRVAFRTVTVAYGDLLATINATGTLEPQETVDVGAQIPGEVKSFGTDQRDPSKPVGWGSPVEEGTVLAHLDDALLKARVDQAAARLDQSKADLLLAEVKLARADRELSRIRKLYVKHQIAAQEYDNAVSDNDTAKAGLAQSQSSLKLSAANLEEANVNLAYATIKSKVKGVVLDRRVNIGQTVVANPNAPSLFLIAKDLSRMEIWASVNETDVGSIHEGQGVRFTVGALPHEEFRGKVSQIRLNATMTQSVVTYTVVVDVENPDRKLLPFLTARLQFEIHERKGALLVPNAALRWEPRVQHVLPRAREAYTASLRQRAAPRKKGANNAKGETRSRERATLWVRQGEFVRPIPVGVSVSDGVHTEIISGEVAEGAEVVVGLDQRDDDTSTGEDDGGSPFLPKIKNNKAKKD